MIGIKIGDVGTGGRPLQDLVSHGREVTVSYLCFEKITGRLLNGKY